jgi:hypothetical protein
VDYLTTQSLIQTVHHQYNFLIHYYSFYIYMDILCRSFNSQTLKIQVLNYMDRQQKYLVTTYRVRQYLIFVFTVGCCHLILCLSSYQGQIFRYDHYSAWMHTWKSSKWQQILSLNLKLKNLTATKNKYCYINFNWDLSMITLHEDLHAFMSASWSELANYLSQQNVFQNITEKNKKCFMSSTCVPWFFKTI